MKQHALKLSVFFVALLSMFFLPALVAHADNEDLDFTLVNKTGYGIKAIYIGPSTSDEWGDNILEKPMENGDALDIKFSAKEKAEKWDLRIEWVDPGAAVFWKALKLTEINKITLHYDRDSGETSAESE